MSRQVLYDLYENPLGDCKPVYSNGRWTILECPDASRSFVNLYVESKKTSDDAEE